MILSERSGWRELVMSERAMVAQFEVGADLATFFPFPLLVKTPSYRTTTSLPVRERAPRSRR